MGTWRFGPASATGRRLTTVTVTVSGSLESPWSSVTVRASWYAPLRSAVKVAGAGNTDAGDDGGGWVKETTAALGWVNKAQTARTT